MKSYETPNYIFHFQENSISERDILKIAAIQRSCYAYICSVLRAIPYFKIEYFLCDTPEEVGRAYGDGEPCNGFTSLPNKIYAVYNEEIKCIGFHEDAHVVSYLINRPNSRAIREGIAMYFDRKWWGIQNMDWASHFIKTGKYISVSELLDNEVFSMNDCSVTYPIMGAFTEWLISSYGIDKYLQFYKYEDSVAAFALVYDQTAEGLSGKFFEYVQLFGTDEALEQRMASMIEGQNGANA